MTYLSDLVWTCPFLVALLSQEAAWIAKYVVLDNWERH